MSNGLVVVGRDDRMGLGSMAQDFCEGMKPDRLVLVDVGSRKGKLPESLSWAGQVISVPRGKLNTWGIENILHECKIVVGFETWYSDQLTEVARGMGVKSVLFPMWEWSSKQQCARSDELICLSKTDHDWALSQGFYPDRCHRYDWPACPSLSNPLPATVECPKCRLILNRSLLSFEHLDPVRCPGCLEGWVSSGRRKVNWPPKVFAHFAGNASHNRDGTREVLLSARYLMGTGAELRVYSSFDLGRLTSPGERLGPIALMPSATTRREMFDGVDCLVFPRRLGGHSLATNEAAGEGIPTIVLDLPDWQEWPYRVPAHPQPLERFGNQTCPVSRADPEELGQLMRQMALGVDCRSHLNPKVPSWDEFRQWWQKEIAS